MINCQTLSHRPELGHIRSIIDVTPSSLTSGQLTKSISVQIHTTENAALLINHHNVWESTLSLHLRSWLKCRFMFLCRPCWRCAYRRRKCSTTSPEQMTSWTGEVYIFLYSIYLKIYTTHHLHWQTWIHRSVRAAQRSVGEFGLWRVSDREGKNVNFTSYVWPAANEAHRRLFCIVIAFVDLTAL